MVGLAVDYCSGDSLFVEYRMADGRLRPHHEHLFERTAHPAAASALTQSRLRYDIQLPLPQHCYAVLSSAPSCSSTSTDRSESDPHLVVAVILVEVDRQFGVDQEARAAAWQLPVYESYSTQNRLHKFSVCDF